MISDPSPNSLAYQLAHTPMAADMRASVERTVAQLFMPYLPPSKIIELRVPLWPDYPWRGAVTIVGLLVGLPTGVTALFAALGSISWIDMACASVGFGLVCLAGLVVQHVAWVHSCQVVVARFTLSQGLSVEAAPPQMYWFDTTVRSVDFYVNTAQLAAQQLQVQAQRVQQRLDKAARLTVRLGGTADAGALSLPSDTRSG